MPLRLPDGGLLPPSGYKCDKNHIIDHYYVIYDVVVSHRGYNYYETKNLASCRINMNYSNQCLFSRIKG